MTAAWALPLIALSVFALRRPAAAGPVFVGATAPAVLSSLADSAFGIIRRGMAPVVVVVVFAIGVALAFLGLHRAELSACCWWFPGWRSLRPLGAISAARPVWW